MKRALLLALALGVGACSDPPPPPPKPKPVAKAPEAAPAPPATPEVRPTPPPTPDPNKELAARVKQALDAPENKLPSGAIDVTAQDGRVSLWGAVPTADLRARAAQVAQKVDGVKGVDNQLKVVKGS